MPAPCTCEPPAACAACLSGTPLHDVALRILLTPCAASKAALSLAAAAAWAAGALPLCGAVPFNARALVPAEPARPPSVTLVHPLKVKNGSRKATIHSLTHAENVAIDLSWDIIARFGWSPGTWGGLGVEAAAPAPVAALSEEGALPREFFDDWVRVAGEEASHFLRWQARLNELGASYGDLPAHGSLWESAADTAHSLAARLAIVHCVHEGRGLDVAGALAGKFAGDEASLAVLAGNVAQEVHHVGFAVKWLTRVALWNGEASPLPLFHALVKRHFHGNLRPPFAVELRAKAGMSAEWYEPLAGDALRRGGGS